jgi:murein L,D-transpeptidase YcbB/YkuD
MSLAHHLRNGKVDPRSHEPVWNFRVASDGHDPVDWIERAVSAPSLIDFVRAEIPRGAFYNRLRASLAQHRDIAVRGGWSEIPQGATIWPGDSDSRIAVLASRLAISSDIDDPGPDDTLRDFDEGLQAGVRHFQTRHGLEADGVVGPRTLRSLNIPVDERIGQLRLTLERARWVLDGIEDNVVVVNIAGFRAYVVSGREISWETRVVVGKPHQQTPVFRDELQYIVFNPNWTVPYSIATREMLPQLKADSTYFASRDFDIRDKEGNFVDPANVDWEQVTRRNFGYTFIQRPGSNNALGQVKFMFPNEHAVYLHDTPRRELFGLAERAFSHGCIRVADPLHLAELLLRNDGWDRKRIDDAVRSGKTRTVYLSKRMPILLLYWTASVDPDGLVHFYDDVYQRDPAIAQALDAPFSIGRAPN